VYNRHSALAHSLESPGQREKHTALDYYRDEQILDRIQQNAEKHTSISKKKIKDHCISQFKASTICNWVNSFILRDPDGIIQTKSVPEEQQRVQVPQVFLEKIEQSRI
jgi:hypothetical protein